MRKFILPALAALALAASASTGFAAETVRAINGDGTVSLSSGLTVRAGSMSVGTNELVRQQCLEAEANRQIPQIAQYCGTSTERSFLHNRG